MPQSFFDVKAVFEQWSMYDAVVQAGYMYHGELVATLAAWAREQHEPLRIVDLGCGDAWLATHAFRDANVAAYHGVDVSESAASRAREHTGIWPGRATVTAGNLAEHLSTLPDDSANVVLASYSLHHFLTGAKVALIADSFRVLAPGGTFLWIDAVRNDNETRDGYVARLTHIMENDWTALTPEQRDNACTHVRQSDYPETAAWMRSHVEAAGFTATTAILEHDFFSGWAFAKPT